MPSAIIHKILARTHQPDLLRILSEELSGSELNTLLLEVFGKRTKQVKAPELLNLYRSNQYVKPADIPMLELKRVELELLMLFDTYSFNPIELSPVSVLGSCSVVAPADQKKIISAIRGTEVLADATNAIALHCCDLKKQKAWKPSQPNERLRFGTIQRHVRTQPIAGKGFTPHFKIGCVVTSGADSGSYQFEKESLLEHMVLMDAIYKGYYNVDQLSFRLLCKRGYADAVQLAALTKEYVQAHRPELLVTVDERTADDGTYYKGIQFKVDIVVKGKQFEIGDGGLVDWPQQLLQNKKERMLITGFGFEFMYRILRGTIG